MRAVRTATVCLALLMLMIAAVLRGLLPAAAADKGAEGFWHGLLKAGAIDLRLGAVFSKSADGTFRGVLDSLDEGATDIPMDEVKVAAGMVTFTIKLLSLSYQGTLSEDGQSISGVYMQRGVSLPFTLHRADKRVANARPQHPRKPYPYVEEEVGYTSGALKFAGTFTKPGGDGPFPAMLLITGSGRQDRDATVFGHKWFLVLADHLTRNGIAVLRVDDRGVGGSTGVLTEAGIEEQAGDVLAGIAYLKGRKDVRAGRIGLIGHSEGGMVAPLAAIRSRDVAFVVLLAAPGITGEAVLLRQYEDSVRAARQQVSEHDLAKALSWQRRSLAIVKEGPDAETIRRRLQQMVEEELAALSGAERQQFERVKAQVAAQVEVAQTPWFRSFVRYDPAVVLAKVTVPVLALTGSQDVQVAAKENLAAIAAALRKGGNADATVKELAGLNHLLQHSRTGAISEYGQIEETIAPRVLEEVTAWLLSRAGRQ